ncbi:MAG: MaoC family dehydratase [Halobacteria archaeon]
MTGLYYEDFEEGMVIEHDRSRTVSESDNQRFCDLTMNQQPLHLDDEFASETVFGERLVNGLLTMSLAVSFTIPDTSDGTIVANLSYEDVEHPNPVHHGDTISASTTVKEKRETSDGERGVVTMGVEATNQDGKTVCSFERTVLSLKRSNVVEKKKGSTVEEGVEIRFQDGCRKEVAEIEDCGVEFRDGTTSSLKDLEEDLLDDTVEVEFVNGK